MERSQLMFRLRRLRSTIRRRLIAYGVCAVSAGGATAFLTIVVLDWFLWLPPLLRIVVAGLFLTGLVLATYQWVVRPLTARLGLAEVAGRLETHFGSLRDRLTSTVDFLTTNSAGSNAMMRHVVADTERLVVNIPLESVLTLRPLLFGGALMLTSLGLLAGIRSTAPDWMRVGFYRYVHPWGGFEWPRTVSILPLTGDQIAAVGESVTVGMQVRRGLSETLRGVVYLQEVGGRRTALAMQRDDQGRYTASINAVTEDLIYWFEAGDDNTSSSPYTIRVYRRPEVVEALATVVPPPYAAEPFSRVHDLSDGPVHVPIGGRLELNVLASKPIPAGTPTRQSPRAATAALYFEDGSVLPLTVQSRFAADAEDSRRLAAGMTVTHGAEFRIKLRDEHGFENRGAQLYRIVATPDRAPIVTILEPTAVAESTPQGSVGLLIRVEDDFGIVGLKLEVQRVGEDAAQNVPLSDQLETVRDHAGLVATASLLWNIAPLSLSAGDVLVVTAVATDNHPGPSGGQVGRSADVRIVIISDAEFEIRLRMDLALLEAQIRRIALDEADVLDQTEALRHAASEVIPLLDAQRGRTASLASRQARLIRRLGEVARRFRKMTGRMERNHAQDAEAHSRVHALSDALREVATGPMTEARAALDEARENNRASEQQRSLTQAVRSEETAIATLHVLLQAMSGWGNFQELVSQTKDLLDRQDSLRTRTTELGKSMLGKPVASLAEAQAGRLKRLAREQRQLGTDVERHLARMRKLAVTTREASPEPRGSAGADAIDDALRTAHAHDIEKQLETAVKTIKENRTAAAALAQKAAANALRKMVDALNERRTRALEELRKRLETAQDRVALLIEQQRALRSATQEAGLIAADAAALSDLARAQRTLRTNTRLLGEELAREQRVAVVGNRVRRAAAPMGRAERRLREQQVQSATAEQDDAIAMLNEAFDQLEAIAQRLAAETMRRSLAQIRQALEAVAAVQREVNEGIVQLQQAIQGRGRIARVEARAATRLARRQKGASSMVQAQLHEFKKVIVYQWALERVANWMNISRERLTTRRIDDELVGVTARIVHELETLIQAIVDTQALPLDTQFVESESGGGGGETGGSKPVPTVAELLVLRSMQVDINKRTKSLHASVNVDRADEEELRGLTVIGEDQAEVRRLTQRVTRRMREP